MLAPPLILGTLLAVTLTAGTDVLGARLARAAEPPAAAQVAVKPGAGPS